MGVVSAQQAGKLVGCIWYNVPTQKHVERHSHRTNWTEVKWGPRIYRCFDFHSKWKIVYEHLFLFSNSKWCFT